MGRLAAAVGVCVWSGVQNGVWSERGARCREWLMSERVVCPVVVVVVEKKETTTGHTETQNCSGAVDNNVVWKGHTGMQEWQTD